MFEKFVKDFNSFFKGDAEIKVNDKDKQMEIIIGTRTMDISLPSIIGGSCQPKDQ